jgi:hypothetical protein
MVLEVRTDTPKIGNHGHAVSPQVIGGSNARDHQDLGRLDDAGGEDDTSSGTHTHDSACAGKLEPNDATPVEHQSQGLRAGPDHEIGSPAHGRKKCVRVECRAPWRMFF